MASQHTFNAQGIKWNLSDLYSEPNDPTILQDLDSSLRQAEDFQKKYKEVNLENLSPQDFFLALQEYESIIENGLKPLLYASLLFTEDTQNDFYKNLRQRALEKWNAVENILLFFRLAIINLSENKCSFLLSYEPLQEYAHTLQHWRRFREFTLQEKEEYIINCKNLSGKTALATLFDEFTSSFTFRLTIDDEEKELTGSEMLALLYSPHREIREKAYRTFLNKHKDHQLVLTSIFNALFLDAHLEDEIRGYKGPMHRTHLENEISPEIVELMMEITENSYPLAQEYFRLKAALLELPKLKNTDIYAPLPGGDKKITFGQARDLLLQALHDFYPPFGEIAEKFFDQKWIDAEIRRGKYGGAFCSGLTPSLHPYLLMNFTGSIRDLLTLAHEIGHGIHFYLARQQKFLNFDPPLILAETASVFCEMIMIQTLLKTEPDKLFRQALLCLEIEDIIATVFRQNVLTRFEEQIYRKRQDHLLSAEEIGELWWQANAALFGESVEMIPEYQWGWSYISHFVHSRFYCYSYVFGELVVLALYQKYLEEGEGFLPKLQKLLASGGAKSPEDLLHILGINIREPSFWEGGCQIIQSLIHELRKLASPKDPLS